MDIEDGMIFDDSSINTGADNDKVNITSEKRNMSSSFNPDCIVTNAGDFLSKIVDTVAASERITYRNDMKDIAKLLNEKNMNTGVIKKFFVNRKHVSDHGCIPIRFYLKEQAVTRLGL